MKQRTPKLYEHIKNQDKARRANTPSSKSNASNKTKPIFKNDRSNYEAYLLDKIKSGKSDRHTEASVDNLTIGR